MDPALASLLGAVVGGSIVSGSSVLVDRARARREAAAARTDDERELRLAARLLIEELEVGRRLISRSIEREIYMWDPGTRDLPADVWGQYRSVLAKDDNEDLWRQVAHAFNEFDRLNWHLRDLREEDAYTGVTDQLGPLSGRPVERAARLREALSFTDAALTALREQTRPSSGARSSEPRLPTLSYDS